MAEIANPFLNSFQPLLTYAPGFKSDLSQRLQVENISPIKDEGRFVHSLENPFEVERPKFVPFSQNQDGVSILGGGIGILLDHDVGIRSSVDQNFTLSQILSYLIFGYLRVVDGEDGLFVDQVPTDIDRSRFACTLVSFLKAKPSTAIFFPATVLNRLLTTCWE